MNASFFAFYKPGPDRELSSWFLASKENCPLVKIWCKFVNNIWSDKTIIEVYEFGDKKNNPINRHVDRPWLKGAYWMKPTSRRRSSG